jgi:hypothetical protein
MTAQTDPTPNSRRSPLEHEHGLPDAAREGMAELARLGQQMDAQTDAPERVWCKTGYDSWYSYGHWYDSETGGGVPYVRADALDAAQAEIAKLRAALEPFALALKIARGAMCPHPDRGHIHAVALLYVKHEDMVRALNAMVDTQAATEAQL